MYKERQETRLIVPLATVGLLVIGSFGAFSNKVRGDIWKRDKGRSVLSGETENLQASHISHDKKNPRYNDPSNGRMLTAREHYKDHYYRHGRNGLPTNQNKWSLRILWGQLTDEEKEGLPGPDSITD